MPLNRNKQTIAPDLAYWLRKGGADPVWISEMRRSTAGEMIQNIKLAWACHERYKEGLKDLPVSMNPIGSESIPNYWLSCMLINEDAMCETVRGEKDELWITESSKSCPGEILAALASFNAEGRPIWKPMHMQPIYRMNGFVTREGNGRARSNAYISGSGIDVGADVFRRGLCLPSDNKMTVEQQEKVIEIIRRCFR